MSLGLVQDVALTTERLWVRGGVLMAQRENRRDMAF